MGKIFGRFGRLKLPTTLKYTKVLEINKKKLYFIKALLER